MDFDSTLYVAQTIQTIQGEGDLIGVPSVLVRFAGCNCRCSFCDTAWSWFENDSIPIDNKNFSDWLNNIYGKTNNGLYSNLMITGGEPLLYKNNPFFKSLLSNHRFKSIEIETNGSLLDADFLNSLTSRIKLNISPKLNEDWYLPEFKVTSESIFRVRRLIKEHDNYIFKFVDQIKSRDSMFKFIDDFGVPRDKIYLMPLTPNRKTHQPTEFASLLKAASIETLKLCMEHGFNFVPRLHLYLFDNEEETI